MQALASPVVAVSAATSASAHGQELPSGEPPVAEDLSAAPLGLVSQDKSPGHSAECTADLATPHGVLRASLAAAAARRSAQCALMPAQFPRR